VPTISRFAIKVAMAYLVVAAVMALLYWLNALWAILPSFSPYLQALSPTYIHLLTVGWLTQFIYGVMYWMFPIVSKAQPRGNVNLAWGVFVSLNAGLVTRLLSEPWRVIDPNPINAIGMALSAMFQVLAAALFVGVSWGRVRERGGF
jgi:hypothetical protein